MSDINPNDLQNGIEASGYLAGMGGLLLTAWGWIIKRGNTRLVVLEGEEKNNVKKEDYHRDLTELKSGMKEMKTLFTDLHGVTHTKIDNNQEKIIDLIVKLAKKE